jgi:hypothetical protein
MEKYANVDRWLAANPRWRAEAKALRPVLLDCGLSEAVKWGKPCCGHEDNNLGREAVEDPRGPSRQTRPADPGRQRPARSLTPLNNFLDGVTDGR